MRYSREPNFSNHVKGYGFLSFARRFGDKYGKKLMDTATKTEIDAAKTNSKRVVRKNKIFSLGKTKSKEKEKEEQETCISPEEIQLITDDLRLF